MQAERTILWLQRFGVSLNQFEKHLKEVRSYEL
ncbi:hypothetical protein BX591_13533 [Paraburkholderia bryophila]|jgi:hypothetical protein|uniref:Uncharacterized protein n=1 Tax=Paraburkholderia bryophila TaxID=420952 RepID=A0A329BNT2_9BURK|nr:hypothetical protein BX591_13533 [Paraburkholderia bryophila]